MTKHSHLDPILKTSLSVVQEVFLVQLLQKAIDMLSLPKGLAQQTMKACDNSTIMAKLDLKTLTNMTSKVLKEKSIS